MSFGENLQKHTEKVHEDSLVSSWAFVYAGCFDPVQQHIQKWFPFLFITVLMRNKKTNSILVIVLVFLCWGVYGGEITQLFSAPDNAVAAPVKNVSLSGPVVLDKAKPLPAVAEPEKEGIIVAVAKNDTLIGILARHQVATKERQALCRAVSEFFDLRRLRPGHTMELLLSDEVDNNGNRCLERLRLMTELDVLVEVTHSDHASFSAVRKPLQHKKTVREVSGSIDSSFFLSARKLGVSREIFTEFYHMVGARVDFQREIRKGDSFQIVYEEYDDSPYGGIHAGRLLYASLTLQNKSVAYYQYTTHDGFSGFFDENGNSVDSQLLRTPLAGGVLSSLFGSRKHPVLGYQKMHRGVDFSARRGTPVLAAGDGVVETVGRYGNYGKFIKIRHGSEFMTGYAHLQGYAKDIKPGTRVSQGDVIGYVGSTGLATGPNLHYEVFRYGKRINPMTLKLPPIKSLHGEELLRFREYLKGYKFMAGVQSV